MLKVDGFVVLWIVFVILFYSACAYIIYRIIKSFIKKWEYRRTKNSIH